MFYSLIQPMKQCIQFEGRTSRKSFWFFWLWQLVIYFLFLLLTVPVVFFFAAFESVLPPFLWVIPLTVYIAYYIFLVVVVGLSISVRRLHDTNRSGLWLLLSLASFLGLILLYFYIQKGTDGPNRFGEKAT